MKKYIDFGFGSFLLSFASLFFSAVVMSWIEFVENGFAVPHC